MDTFVKSVQLYFKKRLVYIIGWVMGYLPLSLLVRVYGRKNIPMQGGAVVVANHETYMDPYIITGLFPVRRYLRWIAKESLHNTKKLYEDAKETDRKLGKKRSLSFKVTRFFGYKFSVFFAHSTGTIIIKSDRSTVKRVVKILSNTQHLVGIFPTGVRRFIDNKKPPRKGFVVIAREAKVPVVPVALYRMGVLRWRMEILSPIASEQLTDDTFGTSDEERARTIMAHIDAHVRRGRSSVYSRQ